MWIRIDCIRIQPAAKPSRAVASKNPPREPESSPCSSSSESSSSSDEENEEAKAAASKLALLSSKFNLLDSKATSLQDTVKRKHEELGLALNKVQRLSKRLKTSQRRVEKLRKANQRLKA